MDAEPKGRRSPPPTPYEHARGDLGARPRGQHTDVSETVLSEQRAALGGTRLS